VTEASRPIAVVTGASSGFGYATALHLARNGWHVAAAIRTMAKAARLQEAADGLPLSVVELDITRDDSVAAAFAAVAALGPVTALVNNAGISAGGPLETIPDGDHRLMFETNYFGAVRCIKAVLPGMRERGHGIIVNVTSTSGVFPWPNQAAYAASKWALEGLGASLAHEVRRFGIRVCNVEPGAVRTEIVEASKARSQFDKASPYLPIMKRNGRLISAGFRAGTTPDDVAAVVLDAMTDPTYRLRWPAGPDAEAIVGHLGDVSLDEFVALGDDVADDDYEAWFRTNLGIEL